MTITTPVEINQTVWFIENNMIQSGKLKKIEICIVPNHQNENLAGFRYTVERGKHIDSAIVPHCFPTKAELLASL